MTTQLFPPLDKATEDALRASIERFGVLVPVVRNQHGEILDGHHRSRLAAELGVDCRVELRETEDDWEAREIARTLNADRRHLTIEQRRAVVGALREEGHSQRAIAGALRVSPSLVAKDLGRIKTELHTGVQFPERVTGLDGKSRPASRLGLRQDTTKPYEIEKDRQRQIAEKAKGRLAEGMGMANGVSRVLVDLDFGMVAAVSTPDEIKAWEDMAGRLAASFRKVKQSLSEVKAHAR